MVRWRSRRRKRRTGRGKVWERGRRRGMIGGRRRKGVGGMMVLRGGSWLFLVGAGVMARSQGKRGGAWDRKSGKGCVEQGLDCNA